MATPNETFDLPTRIEQAKAWLQEHDNETITTASHIFKLTRTTLCSAIHRPSSQYGGQNQILTSSQEQSINLFIQSYLNHGLLPTKGVLISAITRLRALENKPPPSASWFQKWWKTQPLHKIKTKPIARVRITAQDKDEVSQWFVKYKEVVKKHEVSRKDIWNFEESGFTTDQLTLRFLEWFITYTKAGPREQPKLLLMDNHGSHITPEFILLARKNHVIPFSFPAHLTHCMQPCDVGIFQAMKHWHSKAIQCALETLDFD